MIKDKVKLRKITTVTIIAVIIAGLASGLVSVLALSLNGYFNQSVFEFDSLEELQSEFPDYYYFDFDLDIFGRRYAALANSKHEKESPYGYEIFYDVRTEGETHGEASLKVFADKNDGLENYYRRQNMTAYYLFTVDGIECHVLQYYSEDGINRNKTGCYFVIEEVLYEIRYDEVWYDEISSLVSYNKKSIEKIMSFITPAIEFRYKGIRELTYYKFYLKELITRYVDSLDSRFYYDETLALAQKYAGEGRLEIDRAGTKEEANSIKRRTIKSIDQAKLPANDIVFSVGYKNLFAVNLVGDDLITIINTRDEGLKYFNNGEAPAELDDKYDHLFFNDKCLIVYAFKKPIDITDVQAVSVVRNGIRFDVEIQVSVGEDAITSECILILEVDKADLEGVEIFMLKEVS